MAHYESIDYQTRKKILWRAITSKNKIFKSVLGFMLVGAIISLIKKGTGLTKSKSDIFENLDLHIIIIFVLGSVVLFIIIYLIYRFFFTLHYKSLLKKLESTLGWDFIDIDSSTIHLRKDYKDEIISKNQIQDIYFLTSSEKTKLLTRDWDKPVNLNIVAITTNFGSHYLTLEIIRHPANMLTDLNAFFPFKDFESVEYTDPLEGEYADIQNAEDYSDLTEDYDDKDEYSNEDEEEQSNAFTTPPHVDN